MSEEVRDRDAAQVDERADEHASAHDPHVTATPAHADVQHGAARAPAQAERAADRVPVRDAREDELDSVIALLDLAFEHDPFVGWLTRGSAEARRRYVTLVTRRLVAPRGRIFVDDSLRAVALWMPPGGWNLPIGTQLRMLPTLTRVVGARRLFGVARVSAAIEEGRPEAHWYLALVGTRPDARGTGLGAAVVEAGVRLAKEDGVPALLETSNLANVRWYERFGFAIRRRLDPPGEVPPIWTLST